MTLIWRLEYWKKDISVYHITDVLVKRMWLFFALIFFILICNSIFSDNADHTKRNYVLCVFSLLAFLAMFKADTVGNDTNAYIDVYNNIASSGTIASLSLRYEKGFLVLCKILTYITKNPQILFIVCGIYIFSCCGYVIYRFSLNPCLSTLMFFLLYFDLALSGVRHIMALATIAVSLIYIINKKPIKFVCMVIIAAMFHKIALCFFLAYPLSIFNRRSGVWKFYVGMLTIVFMIFFTPMLHFLISIFPQYQYYVSGTYMDGRIRYASVLDLFILVMIYSIAYYIEVVYRKKIRYLTHKQKLLLPENGYNAIANLTLMSCMFMLISFKATILSRLANIVGFFGILYCPNMIAILNHRYMKLIFSFVLIIVLIAYKLIIYKVRPEWISTYPYTFCLW